MKPVRPRRQAAAHKRYASPPKNEPKSIPQRQKKKPAAAKRAVKKTKWDAESILKDPKSPLATANLRVCLTLPCFNCRDEMSWLTKINEHRAFYAIL